MINKINCCTNRAITSSFQTIEEVVNFIKTPPPEHISLVEQARSLNRKSNEYGDIKRNRLPAISVGFSFSNNYIIGENIDSPTGYLYLDVDGITEIDFDENESYVCAYWKSLSNTGISIIIKVDGLTTGNLKTATQEIAKLLNVPYDTKAVSIDRLTVLSYDPDAMYNSNSITINLNELLPPESTKPESSKVFRDSIYYNNSLIGIQYNGNISIRNNNLDEVTQDMHFDYNEKGIHDCGKDKVRYISAYLPKNIKEGSREKVLSLYARNIMYLNPNLTKNELFKLVSSANMLRLNNPLPYNEFKIIVEKTYANRLTYRPPEDKAKSKRFFFQDNTLTTVQKTRLSLEVIHDERRQKTQEKKDVLSKIFCNWNCHEDGKITPKKIMEQTGFKKTIVYDYFKANPEEIPNCNT
ncbi:BT4734/BF3469 family protein [Elizabethkingia anophelis]|uniref:BT4734/BF3469 family protein n=1 Tax=Elizabethkingia anophelis TaxID=1117645 RepID=UPI0003FBAE51|nr:BT4734/BF3469 family protein [Elizabethkingia anophelis]